MKKWIGIILAVLVLIGGGYFVYQIFFKSPPPAAPVAIEPQPKPELVSAESVVIPAKHSELAWKAGGRIVEIVVHEGDTVKAGAVLARLDDTTLQAQVNQAEAQVTLAQKQLDQLNAGGSPEDFAAANQNIAAANAAYDALLHPTESKVTAAQASLSAARAAYNKLLHPNVNEIAIAKADVDKARAAVSQAQSAYDKIGGSSNPYIDMTREALQLQQATLEYQRAQSAYDAQFQPTDAQLKAALAQIQQAQDQLTRLQNPGADALAQVQSQIDQAKQALAHLTPRKEAIDVARAQLDAAKASLVLVKSNVQDAVLSAPFDGTVSTIDVDLGQIVSPGEPAISFADMTKMQIQTVDLAEVDVAKVQIGQPVTIKVDAFPGKEWSGKVTEIALQSNDHRGDKVYKVTIEFQESIPAGLRWGMTANADIQVGKSLVLETP